MKKLIYIGGVLLLTFAMLLGIKVTAGANDDGDCQDHWQRYSWTGGPHAEDSPPAFPGEGWQANVQGDPHGVGQAGAYYRSNGNSGNGDWFYLEWVECPGEEDPDPTCETDPSPELCAKPDDIVKPFRDETCDGTTLIVRYGSSGTVFVWNEETLEWEGKPFASQDEKSYPNHEDCVTDEEPPPTEEPPVVNPPTDDSSKTSVCVGNALVTKVTDSKGNISSSTINGHPSCKTTKPGTPVAKSNPGDPVAPTVEVNEEGM